jgi:hypothetical protein
MKTSTAFKDFRIILYRTVRYNLKIIFGGKFIYFLGSALFIFLFVTVLNLINADSSPNEGTVYRLLLVPGILLIFYPTTFGIQNDVDNRMIEILFGIPNYRYKVWLVRIILIFLGSAVILALLSAVSSVVLTTVPVSEMVFQIMFPILFLGCAAFMVSTLVRNGSGTAVVMVIFGMFFWIARDFFEDHRTYDLLLNPFILPDNMNSAVWYDIVLNNRVYLAAGAIFSLLAGLLNLQKREKFLQ